MIFSLNKKMNAAAINVNDSSLWVFENVSAVIDTYPLCTVLHGACFKF